MEFQDVLKMADYWLIEPPVAWIMAAQVGYGRDETQNPPPPNILPRNLTPFRKLPAWLRAAAIRKSGLTEVEFYRKLNKEALEQVRSKDGR